MVKTEFSIKDLENLSEVKAHTIRIWEKRYNLLEPSRTDTNIRRYDLENLKKLLNITYLYKSGYKISKLAEMTPGQIAQLISQDEEKQTTAYNLEIFKAAILEYDGKKFDRALANLLQTQDFEEIYVQLFIPLLTHTGALWQTGTIDPSHEHFVSEKIKHSLIYHTESLEKERSVYDDLLFVLFLPSGEMHEISILFANYLLNKNGFNSLYLGGNMPLENLLSITTKNKEMIFVTHFTVQPETENRSNYITEFKNCLPGHTLCLLGHSNSGYSGNNQIRKFPQITDFELYLHSLRNGKRDEKQKKS